MSRRYNRKIPAELPAHRMLSRTSVNLPSFVDLRRFCGPVKDQGDEGSCTMHAGTSDGEWIYRAYPEWLPKGTTAPIFSPQYGYERELIMQGDFPNDEGSDGTTLCRVLTAYGLCPLALDPYVSGVIENPTAAQDAAALPFALGAWHGLQGSQTALSVIGDPVPWPVLVGFTVYESFESDEVAKSGVYNPQPNEKVLGGHEVMMCGYDVGPTPMLRPADCPPAALIQNSWGASWGFGGFFWITLRVLDDSSTDLRVAHSGKPWK